MYGKRFGHCVHAGVDRAARFGEGFFRLENHREFGHIVAPHPYERTGAALSGNSAGMRESVARLPQCDEFVGRWQVEGAVGDRRGKRHGPHF